MARPLLRCADRPGSVAAVDTFLAKVGDNIVSFGSAFHAADQRDVYAAHHLSPTGLTAGRNALGRDFAEQFTARFVMDFRLTEAAKPKRVALMASTEGPLSARSAGA